MQKETRKNIFVAATYGATLVLGLILGQNYADQQGNKPGNTLVPIGLSDNTYKLQQVVDLISAAYVDSINTDSIQNGAINHIIAHLDPYSSFLLPKESQSQTEILEGTFEGIGMEYFNLNDTLLIVGLITNGPADKAGFKVGDRILRIDNKPLAGVGVSKEEVDKLIRGNRGSEVSFHIKRENIELPVPIKATRDQINVSSLDVAYMIEPTVGFVRIRRFGQRTADEFRSAIIQLKKQGAQNLILDLRDNGGGYFHVAIQLAGEFFSDKRLIVYTEGAHEKRREYFSERTGEFKDGKLVILVNDRTASASEVVAGAIQDWDRGTIIGRRSYGKGIVQEQFDFADGSTINLSIAKYFTPLGRSIQKKYSANWSNMDAKTSLYKGLWALDTLYAHGQAYKTGMGREVYSGGGIVPDILIPRDYNELSLLYQQISKSNYLDQFVYERFTKQLPAYSIENFLQGYNLPYTEYLAFIEFLNKTGGIEVSAQKQRDLHDLIQTDIEALVGRYYFGREAYFKVKNRDDKYIRKAMEAFAPQLIVQK
ncbi:S41 family peptidase [Sphingobacterium corticibacter]|uniref:S41 family peptidase n=1 Tax=Sphingobacterium corticibacter TaxID=2171749 RepID=A0A2T8HJP8_9SPHI|nr:S41 family peptidase [Sphingobacterium corticibacter]PVH25542.1 S41 family peptidase [Sphingobacterium corticibacter]